MSDRHRFAKYAKMRGINEQNLQIALRYVDSACDCFSYPPNKSMKNQAALLLISLFIGASMANAQPSITTQPTSRVNNIGDNAQFTVEAVGSGTLSYQWKHNGNELTGATGSVLNHLVSSASDAGSYTVVVTDDFDNSTAESSAAVLSIPFASRGIITQWDFNNEEPDGDPGTGTLDPSIGDGLLALSSGGAHNGQVGNMVLNSWLVGSPSDPDSSGDDNSGRSLRGPSPASTANKTAGFGFGVSTVGYKEIAVTWEQYAAERACAYWRGQYTTNGTDWVDRVVVDKRTPYMELSGSSYTFHFDDLSGVPGVAGNPNFAYRIVGEHQLTATGGGSAAYVPANANNTYNANGPQRWDMVTVLGTVDDTLAHPVIHVQPEDQIGYVGGSATFNVQASGGSLEYQWRFEGNNISGATDSSLTLTGLQFGDAGNYSVIVSNSVGFVVSDDAVLTVTAQPRDLHWIGDSGVWDTVTPNWGADAGGPFDLTWDNSPPAGTATLPNPTDTIETITLTEPIVVNRITSIVTANRAYIITGTNLLTFSGDDAGAHRTRDNSSVNNHLTFRAPVTGPLFVKTGDGRVAFDVELVDTSNSTNYVYDIVPNTIQKYHVRGGSLSAPVAAAFGDEPAEVVPDFFTLENGQLGVDSFVAYGNAQTLGATRGITLLGTGDNDIGVSSVTATLTIDGPITGPGNLRFPNFNPFSGGLHGARGTFILSNTNNNYEGYTRVLVGMLQLGNSEVLPDTTSLELTGGSTLAFRGRLDLNGHTETVGNVICSGAGAQILDSVGGGMLIATNYDIRSTYIPGEALSAVLGGDADLTKTTAGIAGLRAANTYTGHTYFIEGMFELNGIGTFGNGQGTLFLIGTNSAGGDTAVEIAFTETRTPASMLKNPVVMTANEATFKSTSTATGDIQVLHGGTWSTEGGLLHLFRGHSDGYFELALTNALSFTTPIDIGFGCQLASFNPQGSDQTFSGSLSGDGLFRRSVLSGAGGRTILTADNIYTGGTVVEAGTLLVNNPSPFGTGTGYGDVIVGAPSGVLGGTGGIAGNVVVDEGGTISAGASAGVLTLHNGLNLSSGGTNVWDLAALADNSTGTPGIHFDQLVLIGGELQLGGNSRLVLRFADGMAPNSTVPFWQAARSWTIVNLNGGANSANATFATVVNGSYGAGNFSTSVSGGNIVLTFTPGAPSAPVITSHPQSRTNIAGTTATFTVEATGSDPLNYHWYYGAGFGNPVGGNNATLTLPNVQPANAGNYFVLVSNNVSTATSTFASLTVVPPPSIQPLSGAGTPNVVISWSSIPGGQYQVQYNTNLATTDWYVLTNISTSGGTVSVTDTLPVVGPQRYYRLMIQ
jgi:autotransporter-associated beta strand protein